MQHSRKLLALIFALALFAASCGTSADIAVITEDDGSSAAPAMESNDGDGADASTESGRQPVEPAATETPVETPEPDPEPEPEPEPTEEPAPEPTEEPQDEGIDADAAALLADAPSATREATVYRIETFMGMSFVDAGEALTMGSGTQPLAVGEIDGTHSLMEMDLGVMFEPMMAELSAAEQAQFRELFGGDDLTMEMITVDDAMYLRSPFIAMIAAQAGGVIPELAALEGIGDGYGFVDLAATGLDAADIGALGGAQGGAASFDAYFDMIESAGTAVVTGTADVRGVETTQYAVQARLIDLLEAQGLSTDQLGLPADELAVLEVVMDFEVFVDSDGLIRRFTFAFDDESLGSLVGEEIPAGSSFDMEMTMDFFDFGDSSISVEAPSSDLVVGDITEALLALQEMG